MYIKQAIQDAPLMYNKIFFEKTLLEVSSLHRYASFGTFCVQIGQLFEAQ